MKNKSLVFVVGVMIVSGVLMFIQNKGRSTEFGKQTQVTTVPFPQEEDTIRLFFSLVDEGRVSEAVMMMSTVAIKDESQKQTWGVMWNAFETIRVENISREADNLYKVVLETKMKPGSEKIMPMPYYGYGNGEFTRWVETELVEGVLKIKGIATSP